MIVLLRYAIRIVLLLVVKTSLAATHNFSDTLELPEARTVINRDSSTPNDAVSSSEKLGVPLRDIPNSIEIRDQEYLKTLGGTQRADQLAHTVAGVSTAGSGVGGNGGSNAPFMTLRGFPNYGMVLRDGGYRAGTFGFVMDMAGIERVEFLKGPSSILFGATNSLGGAVNYVTKRPQDEFQAQADATAGSFNTYRTTFDVGGPVNASKTSLYRINAAWGRNETFQDYGDQHNLYIAPAYTWRAGEKDTIRILTDFLKTHGTPNFGLPLTQASYALPVGKYFQMPGFDHNNYEGGDIDVAYDHAFSASTKFHVDYNMGLSDWSQSYAYAYLVPDTASDSLWVNRDANYEAWKTLDQSVDVRLNGDFKTGSFLHRFVAGANVTWSHMYDYLGKGKPEAFPRILLQGPADNTPVAFDYDSTGVFTGTFEQVAAAPYLQDLITLLPQVKLLLGARYDVYYQLNDYVMADARIYDEQYDYHLSPRAGLVYQPWAASSLYASYSSSFLPNVGKTRSGARLVPETGFQYETGLKQLLTKGVDANLAIYQITKRHVAAPDPVDPNFSVQTGEERSRGVELDVNGDFENVGVNLAYALNKTEITSEDFAPKGTELVNAPHHAFNLGLSYKFGGVLKGLTLGSSYYQTTSVEAQSPNTFRIPGQRILDAYASYDIGRHFTAQLNGNNLLNRRNYGTDGAYLLPGAPISFNGTLTLKY